jgi:hypothetical protein
MVYVWRTYLLVRLPKKTPKSANTPKVTQREMAEFVRERRVEIDLDDVSMLNLQGTAQVILVTEGSGTAKAINAALRRLYPAGGWRRCPPIPVEETSTADRRRP